MTQTYTAETGSGYFRRSLTALRARTPEDETRLTAMIAAPLTPEAIELAWQAQLTRRESPEVALRRFRMLLMMALIERDTSQVAPLREVLNAVTYWAERSIRHALAVAATEFSEAGRSLLDDDGKPQDLLVIGMGKLGGGELNVSSDVDLIFVMRDQGQDTRHAERLARRMVNLLSEVTADGFVFRVDLRLRPYGDSGPLICSLTMLEQYFYEQGREWERFAWFKARVIADSGLAPREQTREDEHGLMQLVTPFVFRRYLDYAAFSALSRLHDLIRTEARKNEARRHQRDNAGFDVKLGRGGIREVEFCAQLFQIVRGGQDPMLRERSTPQALQRLGQRRLLEPDSVTALLDAWTLLRRTEHALQYVDDAQTQWLPDAPDRRASIAAMLGMDLPTFDQRMQGARDAVIRVFDRLLAPARRDANRAAESAAGGTTRDGAGDGVDPAADGSGDIETTIESLPQECQRRISALKDSRRYKLASNETRDRIDRLMQRSLGSIQVDIEGVAPETRVARLCDFLEAIAGRPAYLTLLDEHPGAFDHLLKIMARARWAAEYLLKHPIVLDELLDGQLLEPFDCARWGRDLDEQLRATTLSGAPGADGQALPDVERQMDAIREAHHGAVFRILAQDLEGRLTVEALGDLLSALADEVLAITTRLVWSQMSNRHRETPRFAVIAYGKLGGKELGYASDLDLVYLFDDDHPDSLQIYSQLARKVANWLSTRTAAGQLFEVDLRLRPNGDAGLLVSSLAGFVQYQTESAWVWEHQALTRARFAAGDAAIGEGFETARREILARPRDHASLAAEILAMRKRMHEGHPNRSKLFDLKHDAGGMVDIEFMVQYMVLAWGHEFPELLDNRGNIELLRRVGHAGMLDPRLAVDIGDSYRHYRQLQHQLRLNDAEFARVPPALVEGEARQVRQVWRELFGLEPDAEAFLNTMS